MDNPMFGGSNSEQIVDSGHFSNWGKGLMIVEAFNLVVTFANKSNFVPLYKPISFEFGFENSPQK